MKKIFYSLFLFFLVFVGANSVKADGKCEYYETVYAKNNSTPLIVFELKSNTFTFKIREGASNWGVDSDLENFVKQRMSSGSCPDLYTKLPAFDSPYIVISGSNLSSNGTLLLSDNSKVEKPVASVSCSYSSTENSVTILFRKYQSDYKFCIINYKGDELCSDYKSEITSNGINYKVMEEAYDAFFKFNTNSECPAKSSVFMKEIYTGSDKTVLGITNKKTEGSTSFDGDNGFITGDTFKKNVCTLYSYLKPISSTKGIPIDNLEKINIDGTDKNIIDAGCDADDSCSTEDCNEEIYGLEQSARNIANYCSEFISKYGEKIVDTSEGNTYRTRYNECTSFTKFYDSMVSNKIIRSLSEGCDLLSTDLKDKLIFILDIVKIAGPILAIGLGTLDFFKTVAAGDPDKEMKTTAKRFMTRIAAAVLLFIIPVVLAFLMDVVLGNQSGYNPDNPFCDIVDWKD